MRAIALAILTMAATSAAAQSIDDSTPFQASSQIRQIAIGKIEEGSINNIQYWFSYDQGRGVVSGQKGATANTNAGADDFIIRCEKDPINDRRSCLAYQGGNALGIFSHPDGSHVIGVGRNHFPGRPIYLRIDQQPAISSPRPIFDVPTSARIIRQLQTANKLWDLYR